MIREDRSTTTDMELVFSDRTLSVPYSTFMGAQPDMTDPVIAQQVADSVRDWIYSELDDEIRVNKLPNGEPAKTTDPKREGEFWRGTGGQKVLVMRQSIVSVTWNGERFQYGFRIPQ